MATQRAKHTVLEAGPVATIDELAAVEAELRERFAGKELFFRGQGNLYPHIRSGRARTNVKKTAPTVEAGWISLASQMLGQPLDSPYALGLAKAILQHYGAPTFFVDITSNIGIASWFATHTYAEGSNLWAGTSFRWVDRASYTMRTGGHAYVLVLALSAPELQDKGFLFDLSKLRAEIARPHAQHAWLLLDRPPLLPTPNEFWIATIKIDCDRFRHQLRIDDVFPPPGKDPAYAALRSLPFVQVPSAYFAGRSNTSKLPSSDEVSSANESADRPPTPSELEQERHDRRICLGAALSRRARRE